MKISLNTYPYVFVKWEDHSGGAEWEDKADLEKNDHAICVTGGWKVFEDEKRIKVMNSLAQYEGEELGYGGRSTILKADIIEVIEIKTRKYL